MYFFFKEEPIEFPDRLDVGYERKTELNMTLKCLTQASGRMELPSIEEKKVIGEACLVHVWWRERKIRSSS